MSTTSSAAAAVRHEKLRDLLTTRVERLVGGTLPDAQREFVRQEVDLMLHKGDSSEASLIRVADQIRAFVAAGSAAAKKSKTPPAAARPHTIVEAVRQANAATGPLSRPIAAVEQARASSIVPPSSPIAPAGSPDRRSLVHPKVAHADDTWAVLAAHELEEQTRQTIAQRRAAKKKEIEQCKVLDAQIQLRQSLHEKAVLEDKKIAEEAERQRATWQEEERRMQEAKKQKLLQEKQLRDEQLELARQRRQQEQMQREREDHEAAARAAEQLAKEQELAEARKVKAKQEVQKFQSFNEQFQSKRLQDKEKEREMDRVHQVMFLERLAKQEADRDKVLMEMQERQHRQQVMATRMESGLAERATEDERRAKAYSEAAEARRLAEEKKKAQKAAAEKIKCQQYLSLQMLEHERKRESERERVEHERDSIRREQEELLRKENERAMKAKMAQLKQRRDIEEQIVARNSVRRTVFMSEEERRLNAKLLSKIATPSP